MFLRSILFRRLGLGSILWLMDSYTSRVLEPGLLVPRHFLMRGETAGPRQVARLALSIQNFCDSPAAAKTYAYQEFDEIDDVLFAQESI